MSLIYLFPAAGILTLACAYMVWSAAGNEHEIAARKQEKNILIALAAAIGLTLWGTLDTGLISGPSLHISLITATALATILVQGMYLVGLWRHGIRGLGLILLPVTAIPLILIPVLPHESADHIIHTSSLLETGHLLISLIAYALLTLAALHAVMYLLLDRSLKKKQLHPIMQSMPSLFELEDHLFAQVRAATWLLAIGILTGLTWQWIDFGRFALLNHKVLLALISFAVLALLLAQRKKAAWHGKRASRMVIAAYTLLLLAYFGVKLINSWLN